MGAALRMEAVQQEWKRRKELEMVCDVSPVAVPASAKRARLASCSAPEYQTSSLCSDTIHSISRLSMRKP